MIQKNTILIQTSVSISLNSFKFKGLCNTSLIPDLMQLSISFIFVNAVNPIMCILGIKF